MVPATGGIDGDDDVMIIGTRNCVDQKIQFKIHEDLQDSSIDHTEHTTEDDEHESSDGELCVITRNHGKIYVQDSYWMDVDAEKVDRLPYDVDVAKIYLFPFDPKSASPLGRMTDPGQIFSMIDTLQNVEVPWNVSILTALTIYSFTNVTGGSSHQKELARAVAI